MNERLIEVRKKLNYSQKDFGKRIGCSRDRIANVELGRVIPDELFISHLCNTYNVNKEWLITGKGEMFSLINDDLDYLIGRYGDSLSDNMKTLIKLLLKMPEEKRKIFDEFLDEYNEMRKGQKKDQE